MTASWIILALAFIGLSLLFLEVFLPGMVAGTLGAGFLLLSLIKTQTQFGAKATLSLLIVELVLLALGFWSWARYFPRTRLGRKMVLTESGHPGRYDHEKEFSVDEEGFAVTELRPSGVAEFKGKRCDVVSQSAFITAGEKVKIYQIARYKVVVRKIEITPHHGP